MQALFYATPILYSLSVVIDKVGIDAARASCSSIRSAPAIQQARHAVDRPLLREPGPDLRHDGRRPAADRVAVATFVVGLVVFVRAAPRVAEERASGLPRTRLGAGMEALLAAAAIVAAATIVGQAICSLVAASVVMGCTRYRTRDAHRHLFGGHQTARAMP